jgi:protein-S-isoprenylcysteine O-methyltransferase Ste14
MDDRRRTEDGGRRTERGAVTLWRQARAIVLLPGMVTVAIPAAILYSSSRSGTSRAWPAPDGLSAALGLPFIALGLSLMAWTIRLFATVGQGTLSPWDSTRRLVVRGAYRHVRNPMISGVFGVLLGEAILFRSVSLFVWFLAAVGINNVYIPLVEEPGLEGRFGEDYRLYKQNVPRWIPRGEAWTPPWEERAE